MATKTIKASGGDFSTPEAWVASLPATLTEPEVCEIYNDWPSGLAGRFNLVGITTSSTNTITIRAAAGEGHDGVMGSGALLVNNVNWQASIQINIQHVTVENLRFERASSGNCIASSTAVSGQVTLDSLQAKSTNNSQFSAAIDAQRTIVKNCIIHNSPYGTKHLNWYGANVHNTLFVNCTNAMLTGSGLNNSLEGTTISNTVFYSCTNDITGSNVHDTTGTGNNATSHATDDSSGDGLGSSAVLGITSAEFVDAANDDFHLANGSQLIGAGVNLYIIFTTDIDGDTRPASGAWDIGFDHYVAAGGGVTGDLASIEPTIDSFSAAGVIPATGALLTIEQDIDTFQAAGAGEIFGSLGAIESAIDNFQASGASKITGTLSSTELSIDVIVINGEIVVSGDLVSTEPGVDSFISNGNVSISGDLAAQELLIDTAFISGSNSINGFLSVAESSIDLFSSIGTILITGDVLAQEQQTDSLLITGHLDSKGSLDATELLNDSFLSFGGPIIAGDMAAIELNIDLFLANGGASTIGNFAAQELSIDSFASDGNLLLHGQLSAAELSIDVFSANGSIIITGNLSSQESAIDIFACGLSAEDFIDFKDSIFISGFNTKLHINNINTDIQQR